MPKPLPVNSLNGLRALFVQKWNFAECWASGQLVFTRDEKFTLKVLTPIRGENETNMWMEPKKTISFCIRHPEDEKLSFFVKNTSIRINWEVFAEERINAMLKIIGSISTCCVCNGKYPFPRLDKGIDFSDRTTYRIIAMCEGCGAIVDLSDTLYLEICKLSVGYS